MHSAAAIAPTTRAAFGPSDFTQRVDADVRADAHAVGDAEEDHPGEQDVVSSSAQTKL